MLVDALASQVHWIDHLAPVWKALSPKERGKFYTFKELVPHARTRGIMASRLTIHPEFGKYVMVAAEMDRGKVVKNRSKAIRFEHGAGFSFHGRLPTGYGGAGGYIETYIDGEPTRRRESKPSTSYAGGPGQDGVVMFVNPNHYANDLWQQAYPNIPCVVVGCPKMDKHHRKPPKERDNPPTVALTWHWNCRVQNETRWAFPHYKMHLEKLRGHDEFNLIAHSHPRAKKYLSVFFKRIGVEWVDDLDEVYERADLLVNDSSSVLYEFASLDRPVVVLNAPWFRRNVGHGLRFWSHSDVGINVNEPQELYQAILRALEDPPEQQALRKEAIDATYPYRGDAARRAVQAMRKVLE